MNYSQWIEKQDEDGDPIINARAITEETYPESVKAYLAGWNAAFDAGEAYDPDTTPAVPSDIPAVFAESWETGWLDYDLYDEVPGDLMAVGHRGTAAFTKPILDGSGITTADIRDMLFPNG